MKLLLIGGAGQVGHELCRSLAPLGEVIVTTRSGLVDGDRCETLDLDQLDSIRPLIERVRPDVLVNAAAYTAVDRAEDEAGAAFRANAEAPAAMAAACAAFGALLVHYSTDYVFDGTARRPYQEIDATAPLGVYGTSKLAGEDHIRASGARHMILRTAWVYAAHGSNFLRTMLRLAVDRDELRVVADQVGTPTSARLIADATATMVAQQSGVSGLWHLTAAGQTSWHGFAEAIVTQAQARGIIQRAPRVVPITTAEFPTRAKRPAYSCLDTSRVISQFGVPLHDWRVALEEELGRIATTV